MRPGRAGADRARAAVFGAALEQFEQLMNAATNVGYAARPLLLFYGISQAGRAIAAAHADDPWELSGHGLKHSPQQPVLQSTITPRPGKNDSFSRVCIATEQGGLTEPVELGALWASLPEHRYTELPEERWRRPLRVLRVPEDPSTMTLMMKVLDVAVCGLPNRVFEDLPAEQARAALDTELACYPSAEGWQLRGPAGPMLRHPGEYGWDVDIRWGVENPSEREWVLEQHAPEYCVTDERWLWPILNDAGDALGPMTTWWALLYGLSMLARYHPAPWTHALRVDDTMEAVPLETAMDHALEAVPHLVLEALRQEPFLYSAS
jgi:hypothetical protein